MVEETSVRLDVALACNGDTIRGTVDDHVGDVVVFRGWLELMSAFDIVCARAGAGTTREAGPSHGDGR